MSERRDPARDVSLASYASSNEQLTWLVLLLLRELGGEVTFARDAMEGLEDKVLFADPVDGGMTYRLVDKYVEHDRVKPGGWLHVMSGIAVRVLGVTHEGYVRYLGCAGTPDEHLHEAPVDEFVGGHVPADDVPFVGPTQNQHSTSGGERA